MKNFHCYITNPFDNLCEFVLGWVHTLLFEERNSQVLLTYYPLPAKDYHSFDDLGRFIKGRYVEYRVEYVPCIWITKLLKSMNCGGSSKDSFQGFKIPRIDQSIAIKRSRAWTILLHQWQILLKNTPTWIWTSWNSKTDLPSFRSLRSSTDNTEPRGDKLNSLNR